MLPHRLPGLCRPFPGPARTARRRTPLARAVRAACLVTLGIVLAACNHPQTMFLPFSDHARRIYDLFVPIFWSGMIVFVVVEALLLYSVFRFRARPGAALPDQLSGNNRLEIGWTIAPALVIVVIAVLTFRTQFELEQPPPGPSLNVHVIGHQWWWEYRYPDFNVVTANELRLPVGQVVNLRLESADVIHSFWVPQLGGKRDAIPGRANPLWWRPEKTGEYFGQCAEFCGIQHATMRLRVIVEEPAQFQAWVRSQQAPPAPTAATGRGARLFASLPCAGCHTIAGTAAAGILGPNLTHVGSRKTIVAGTLEASRENVARWIRNPQAIKVGALMPNLGVSEEDANALADYLLSLR